MVYRDDGRFLGCWWTGTGMVVNRWCPTGRPRLNNRSSVRQQLVESFLRQSGNTMVTGGTVVGR